MKTNALLRCFEILARACGLAALLACAAPAQAHKASDAYLQLRDNAPGIDLRWDIALRDLDAALEIDTDGDGRLTWGEVRTAWPAIEAYALKSLRIAGCPLQAAQGALERRSDGAYAALRFSSGCSLAAQPVIAYSLLHDVDPTHRGLLKIERPAQALRLQVLEPAAPAPATAMAATPSPGAGAGAPGGEPAQSTSFFSEGVHHIVTGYDHVLFLLCLLLPAVMQRTSPRGWRPVERLGQAVWPVVGIVSAFTVAHSITLALAALKLVTLPPWFIEPAIALTIILAAVDNLYPLFRGRRGLVSFFFGLIHGFGFAGVLAELDLPASTFAWALLQFNLGLEAGQLAIVLVLAGALYAVRRTAGYPRWVIGGGSAAALALGGVWLVERTSGLSLLAL